MESFLEYTVGTVKNEGRKAIWFLLKQTLTRVFLFPFLLKSHFHNISKKFLKLLTLTTNQITY